MDDIKLRKAYEEAIYSYRPPWVQKWGISYVFIFLLIVVIGSAFIKYPDTVGANIEVTTLNPPVNLIANVNGKIDKVLVLNNAFVKKGNTLLLIESSAKWNDILYLEKELDKVSKFIEDGINTKNFDALAYSDKLSLGSLQTSYADFVGSYHEISDYYSFGYNLKEIEAKEQQLNDLLKVNHILSIRKELISSQLKVGLDQLSMDSMDYTIAGASKYSFNEHKQTILNTKNTVNEANKEEASSLANISQLKYEIQNFKIKNEIEGKNLLLKFKQKYQLLLSNLDAWKKTYVIVSPVNGKVNFATFWAENQYIKAGEVVVSVIPNEKANVKVRLLFPVQKSGKVKLGQRVNIKLENFPYNEYGILVGSISSISDVPNNLIPGKDGGNTMMYSADLKLNNGLVTSYKDTLPVVQQLYGTGEILTDDISLLMRYFSPLKAIFYERVKK